MYLFGKITVKPQLPDRISKLQDIANNIWWTWNINSLKLFEELDAELWEKIGKNPIKFLKHANQEKLNQASVDTEFLHKYDTIINYFNDYMKSKDTWYSKTYPHYKNNLIAYFSAEYGLDETLPIYSGGLGILSGDHCKSASDLGIPFVAVGLLYKQGYSNQYVNSDGMQLYTPVKIDIDDLPILPVKDENGNDVIFDIEYLDRKLYLKIWKINIGRVTLYLLDSDIDKNIEQDRYLTQRLYGGDQETRISQEIILGIGGVNALKVLGIEPTIYHMNEGHCSFASLEIIRNLMHTEHVSFNVAKEIVFSKMIFTTHTPVPAGNDIFNFDLIEKYFNHYWGYFGISRKEFVELALKPAPAYNQGYNMGVLGFKLAAKRNGVSKLHESVTKDLFGDIWPTLSHAELPITHVTNGIHTCTWLQPKLKELYNKYLDPFWQEKIENPDTWQKIYNIPNKELWDIHNAQKQKLIKLIKENMKEQMVRNNCESDEIKELEKSINPNSLVIGFARRFATYKRANLIFRDIEKISTLLNNPDKPILLVFAGKAHPADKQGQELIAQIVNLAKKPQFKGKIVFLENYNMKIARYLISGCDIWLNNPRRPLEASGTSGEKAAVNGVINCSILDGWWFEGYNGQNGWAIGNTSTYKTFDLQDDADSQSIYETLEESIIPTFFDRDEDGTPNNWVKIMKNSITSCGCTYSTQRMLIDYTNKLYIPQIQATTSEDYKDSEKVLNYYEWKQHIAQNWESVKIYQSSDMHNINVDAGNNIKVSCTVESPIIPIEDLAVEVYFARINENGTLENIQITPMNIIESNKTTYTFGSQINLINGGQYGYTYRVIPKHDMILNKYDLGLIKWIDNN
ncbi:MAG: glycosyltransferase family 1 protein [Clostridiales bacterium]|nr:glycosyltransferase family 1 protein [Clostridiales bacterium]